MRRCRTRKLCDAPVLSTVIFRANPYLSLVAGRIMRWVVSISRKVSKIDRPFGLSRRGSVRHHCRSTFHYTLSSWTRVSTPPNPFHSEQTAIMIPRTIVSRTLRQPAVPTRAIQTLTRPSYIIPLSTRCASHVPHQTARWLSSKSLADEKVEEITELFATAQDEFEIAM